MCILICIHLLHIVMVDQLRGSLVKCENYLPNIQLRMNFIEFKLKTIDDNHHKTRFKSICDVLAWYHIFHIYRPPTSSPAATVRDCTWCGGGWFEVDDDDAPQNGECAVLLRYALFASAETIRPGRGHPTKALISLSSSSASLTLCGRFSSKINNELL